MDDYCELRSLLGRVRRRWAAYAIAAAAGMAAAAAALPLAAGALGIWLFDLTGAALVASASAALLASAGAAAVVLGRSWRRPGDRQVARYIEEHAGDGSPFDLRDALVTAVHVIEAPAQHADFGQLIVGRAVGLLRAIEPSTIVPRAALRRAALEGLTGVVVLALAVAAAFPHQRRAAATAWLTWFPGAVRIAVLPGDARIPGGRPVRIEATLHGRGASLLAVAPDLIVRAGGQERRVEMHAAADRFAYEIDSVDRSFEYQVAAGATVSSTYSVTALFPPRVDRIDLHYTYPPFTRLAPRLEEDGGDIFAPAGTRVGIVVHTDKPIAGGELALTSGKPIPLVPAGGATASAELTVGRDDGYRVTLKDGDGLGSAGELEYFIRVMNDRPPSVRIVRPAGDQGITPLEEVVIEARADDDYGIARFDLVYTVAGREPRAVPFTRVTGTSLDRTAAYVLAAEDLGVQPGDVITVYARARDVPRGRPSSEARSDIFFLDVKPFNEEFVSAESQSMGGSGGTPIDALIAAQKDIITATWNLERRASAGRSAEDLRAVREAQAELHGRLEQMLSGARAGGRGFVPPQQVRRLPRARDAGRDPAGAALEAMSRAVAQLERQRTADAIPHEMAALQGLLQAQAEIRRRQVQMQQAMSGGGGGTSRVDRDLSALFDRELQRQQRTMYETPPQPADGEPEGTRPTDAMDRVRDLARRQDELARQQRELATAQLPAEERKRQLERLTREQEELRERLEELEREMRADATQQTPASPRSREQRGHAAPEPARRAADAARRSAGEIARGDVDAASASSGRAVEALRQLEGQMRGSSPEARQRAAGDLQLEAQQIADAQRRITAEAVRLEKERDGTGTRDDDARRRLASDKEKLADRVDALERAASELGRNVPGDGAAGAREAARLLSEQQIGSRMRSSATGMRERPDRDSGGGTPPPAAGGGAAVEQQIARALDVVVDALGGAAPADGRRTTQALDETRAIRERLDRLERQVREAEGRAAAVQGAGQPEEAREPGARGEGQASRGQRGGRGGSGAARQDAGQDLARAQEAYARELQRARDAVGQLQQEARAQGGSTPEQHEFSRSAPGNEPFKQDYSRWDDLRRDIDNALERYESAMAARLAGRKEDDRLSGGGSEQVPDAYRSMVSRYFESIARMKK